MRSLNFTKTHLVWLACLLVGLLVPAIGVIIAFALVILRLNKNLRLITPVAAITSLVCISAYTMCLSVALELVNPNLKQFTFINIAIFLLNVYLVFGHFRATKTKAESATRMSKEEWALLAIFAFVFIWVLSPILHAPHAVNLYSNLYGAEDNSAHLGLINYNISNQSPTYHNKNTGLIETLNTYPQGPHSVVAYSYWTLFGGDTSHQSIGRLFLLYTVILAGLAASFAYIVSLILYRTIKIKTRVPLALLLGLFIHFWVTQYLLDFGFFTQIIAFLTIAILLLLLVERRGQQTNTKTLFILSILACLVIISMAWYLLLFVACLPLLMSLPTFLKVPKYMYALYILVGTVILFPIILSSTSLSGANALLQTGAVHTYSLHSEKAFIMVGSACALLLTTLSFWKLRITHFTELGIFVGAAYTLVGIVALYQHLHGIPLAYYYYKCLALVVVIGIFSLLYCGGYVLEKMAPKITPLALVFILGYFTHSYINPATIKLHSTQTPSTMDVVFIDQLTQARAQNKDLIFLSKCSPYRSYMLTKWSGLLLHTYSPQRKIGTDAAAENSLGNQDKSSWTILSNYATSRSALSFNVDAVEPCTNH